LDFLSLRSIFTIQGTHRQ